MTVVTEVVAKATRRRFTAAEKLRVLREADRCTKPGELGAGSWSILPGSRARGFRTCQGLRPREVRRTLAMACPSVLPSAALTASAPPRKSLTRLNGWPALPGRRFADTLAGDCARLGADADRYSFIAADSHRLLLAGLPRTST
jgi:hypothetical protein